MSFAQVTTHFSLFQKYSFQSPGGLPFLKRQFQNISGVDSNRESVNRWLE